MRIFAILSLMVVFMSAELFSQMTAPESIVWNEKLNCYIISDAGAGKLWKMDNDGNLTQFTNGLTSPKGIVSTTISLWVTDVTKIVEIDPESGVKLNEFPITGARQLNDIAADDFGYLYISDMQNMRIYVFDPLMETSEPFSQGALIQPNGLYYDIVGGLINVSFANNNAKIYSIDEQEGNVNELMTTQLGQLDGIAYDSKRDRFYISSWKTSSIYIFDPAFMDAPELLQSGLNGPADIYYNEEDDVLAVPVMNEGRIEFISLGGNITLNPPELQSPLDKAVGLEKDVTLTWDEVENATGYKLQISTNPNFLSGSIVFEGNSNKKDSHSIQLDYEKTYYWHVKATVNQIESEWSSTRSFSTLLNIPELIDPLNDANTYNPVLLKWSSSELQGITFSLQLSTDNEFNELIYDTVVSSKQFSIAKMEYYKDYFWRVKSMLNDNHSNWTETNIFQVVLNKPSLLSPANSENKVKTPVIFTWQEVEDAESYRIQLSESEDFSTTILDSTITVLTFSFEELKYSTLYFWHLSAQIGENDSEWSETYSFKTENDPTGVNELTSFSNITIYPNPVADNLFIQNPNHSDYNYKIVDLLGNVVFEGNSKNILEQIRLTGLSAGTYILVINHGLNSGFYRIMKN